MLTSSDPVLTDQRPVPQADRLHVVAAVVDAVDAGCSDAATIAEAIGMVGRQGGYYPNAAADLGYLSDRHGCWELTDEGVAFSAMCSKQRVDDLCDRLANLPYVTTFASTGGPERLAAEWSERGLAPETVARRLQTIEAWTLFLLDTDRDVQVSMIEGSRHQARRAAPAAIEAARQRRTERDAARAEAAAAKAAAEGRVLVSALPASRDRFCTSCGISLPSGGGDCDFCS